MVIWHKLLIGSHSCMFPHITPVLKVCCCCCCCCCCVTSVLSDSVWPHRQQPARLPRPWDSPGKNTGVGCHFLLQSVKVKSESEVTQLRPTLSDTMDCSPPGSSAHGIFQARVALCTTTQKPPQTILNRWLCLCSNKTSLDSCAIVCQPQVQVIELTLY